MSEIMEGLASIAPILRLQKADPDARVSYEMLSGALIWSDEELDSYPDGWDVIRYVWHHRTRLILGEQPTQYREYWEAARELFPTWIGFSPSRCSPDAELAKLYLERSEKTMRDFDRWEAVCARRAQRKKTRGDSSAPSGQ